MLISETEFTFPDGILKHKSKNGCIFRLAKSQAMELHCETPTEIIVRAKNTCVLKKQQTRSKEVTNKHVKRDGLTVQKIGIYEISFTS